MLIPNKQDIIHKTWLYRLLIEICDDLLLSKVLRFKGGTCAAMRGFINRFSIDLDFDLIADYKEIPDIRKSFEEIFVKLDLIIKDKSSNVPQYFLKYPSENKMRNTIKIDSLYPPPKANKYEPVLLSEIDRTLLCQTQDTMAANKMAAIIDRYEKSGAIAGRDIFDVHQYFLKGFDYNKDVIKERTGKSVKEFLIYLIDFIKKNVTQTIIDQDLNHLLPNLEFQKIRKILKQEVILFLKEELKRIN